MRAISGRLDFPRKAVSGMTTELEHYVLVPGLNRHRLVRPRSAVHSGIARWVAGTRELERVLCKRTSPHPSVFVRLLQEVPLLRMHSLRESSSRPHLAS